MSPFSRKKVYGGEHRNKNIEFFRASRMDEYLRIMSIYQTCEYKKVSFLTRIIHQPQKSTTESALDVRIPPAQSPHRIIRLLKQAHQVALALHQSGELLDL